MQFPIYQFVFFVFAIMTIGSALMVILVRNPVHSALSLVLTFFNSAVLWMLLQAEFLSLVLIFVYVGAVMTLFLFVVMMINVDIAKMREQFVRYLPIGALFMFALAAMLIVVYRVKDYAAGATTLPQVPANYSNVKAMGTLMYTHYLFPFEVAAVILIVAIIAAIALAFHGRKPDVRFQNLAQQHRVKKEDRLRVVTMKAEKK